ncbi:pyridoxal-dependent decarboxylase [Bradyrhizobium retamae]|uniref:pyridoxal-dependent decarboxylase n=1 Tax=Bradyrhizobium retamae TaxID=1300035 RepID=UPI000B039473|nr:pyridoxal-dependent decarboxylase [Bradyrhizobium retamae]
MLDLHHLEQLDDLFHSMGGGKRMFSRLPACEGIQLRTVVALPEADGQQRRRSIQIGNLSRQFAYVRMRSHRLLCPLFRAQSDEFWGYITNGGTEGNIYGLYLGRELYPNGVTYFSRDTHYSVSKGVHLLGLEHCVVRSESNGEMSYEDLAQQATRARHRPAVVVANIGTTMKEGKDDARRVRAVLRDIGINDVCVHSDAALCGPYAPLNPKPVFDFA